MDAVSLGIFALALLMAAGTPGASILALVSRVLTRGPADVLPFLAAMWIGEAIWLTAALVGLTQLAAAFQPAFQVLKYLGVAYLLYLAWKMWHQPVGVSDELPESGGGWGLFLSGMALTLGNPKIMVFYVALLPTFFDLAVVGLSEGLMICLVMLLVLAFIDLAYVALAARARLALQAPKVARRVNRVSATVMGGAAVVIASK